ncbi:putative pectinesterase/pectinesterase inhibitor 28 [Manihot esculenta]|uniref:Uncharacterized protein n=2 Tax=Manihot esculenta TaxID=3983 RepID=A0ACB7GJQ5_MANES|nr:putative pectinesterase/pectinesterase inhibitor 28 [Manihot esculenta]KAG8640119.1 hypothetical protein MANES_13G026900v8 [Manihot esculenta]
MGMNMKFQCSFPLVFLATTTTLLFGSQATAKVSDICSVTDYKPLCRATLKGISDPYKALEAAIDQAIIKTRHAYYLSRTMGSDQNIDICKEMFDSGVTDLESSLKALKVNDKGTLNSQLSAVISYYSTCDDTYSEAGETNPLTKVTGVLTHMVANCLALAEKIH